MKLSFHVMLSFLFCFSNTLYLAYIVEDDDREENDICSEVDELKKVIHPI